MRRPSTEHNEDDLNRLTTSASVRSNESVNSQKVIKTNSNHNDSNNNNNGNIKNNSSSNYLPNLAIEYQQQCRKRKDRQDSTSSLTQDRKVVRSNSEENVPTAVLQAANDAIRRVSSHEDFNKRPQPLQQHNENDENKLVALKIDENALDEEGEGDNQSKVGELTGPKNKLIDVERSQVQSQVHDFDENENRRNSERFLKTKSPSGRKSPRRPKKSSSPSFYQDIISRNSEGQKVDEENDENLPRSKPLYPWESSIEDNPIMCQRFRNDNSTSFDQIHHSLEKFIKSDHDLVKPTFVDEEEEDDIVEEKKRYRNFMSVENVKTRDIMQKSHSPLSGVYQTPDERIRQINKRLTSLKKKISNYEETFENNYGYRPSHADKASDKNIKNYIAEIHKLRKEKSQIKTDPMTAMGYKNKFNEDSSSVEKKLGKIKESLQDIENKLHDKRCEENRPPSIDDMSIEQLVDEKSSVQRALLYFESIYGRPGTSEERDAARPLYDRYRLLKRLVNRNNSFSGGIELPTILENEALALSGIVTPSTDFSPPSAHSAIQSPSDSSTSTSFDAGQAVTSDGASTSFQENFQLHSMSISQLHRHFDAVREEKKQLRRTIKEFEHNFEEVNGRKMLKSDRSVIDETYTLYKEKKAKLRLLDALVKKQMSV